MDARGAETEKMTINLGVVDLGRIDLLVDQGFYSSRTDFVRSAVRDQLGRHADDLRHAVARRSFGVGVFHYDRPMLEEAAAAGGADLRVVGVLAIAADVPPELARAAIRSLEVRGVLRAPAAVKAALADRMA